MATKGIGPQGLGIKGHKGLWIGDASNNEKAMKEMIKRKDGSKSEKGLWDNVRANKGSGKKPTKAMLAQAKKIENKKK
jgi:hypothetical protein